MEQGYSRRQPRTELPSTHMMLVLMLVLLLLLWWWWSAQPESKVSTPKSSESKRTETQNYILHTENTESELRTAAAALTLVV